MNPHNLYARTAMADTAFPSPASRRRGIPPQPETKTGFACVRCGQCCRREGQVRLQHREIEVIAKQLCLAVATFTADFTRLAPNRSGLILTTAPGGACIFLQPDNTCRIHDVKPHICRNYPVSRKHARMTGCPGFHKDCARR